MNDIAIFILIQVFLIVVFVIIWIIRNLLIKNKKLEEIASRQSTYLIQMYEAINAAEVKIKELDANQIFQSDDEIGWYFTLIKQIQEKLLEYTKFLK